MDHLAKTASESPVMGAINRLRELEEGFNMVSERIDRTLAVATSPEAPQSPNGLGGGPMRDGSLLANTLHEIADSFERNRCRIYSTLDRVEL